MNDGNREYKLEAMAESEGGNFIKIYAGPEVWDYLIQIGGEEDCMIDDGVALSYGELMTLKNLLAGF